MYRLTLTSCMLLFCCSLASGQEPDIITKIERHLPEGWTCELESFAGNAYVKVTTTEMDTVGSPYGNADIATTTQKVSVRIRLMPRFSKAMWKRAAKFNAPLEKQLELIDYFSDEYREISRNLIDVPMCQNSEYGLRLEYLPRVPKTKDSTLRKFLISIAKDWESAPGNSEPKESIDKLLARDVDILNMIPLKPSR